MEFLKPVALRGDHVVLEPLSHDHHDGLVDAVRDGRLWELWYTRIPSPDDMAAEIDRRLAEQAAGTMLPFTVRQAGAAPDRGEGPIVGMTTFMAADAVNRRVEIGSTWTSRSAQRTSVNTESKLLLLTHAFDVLGVIAVEFRTHRFNHGSREAIAKLGAQQDGILRNHQRMPDGTLRDTVVFSILDSEWPTVRSGLVGRLRRNG